MRSRLSRHISENSVPQSEALPGQVQNNAGGHCFEVTKWDRLLRFLILGTEGGTYYVSERKLTIQNAKSLLECLDDDYVKTIEMIVDVSVRGRAPKQNATLFALAVAASSHIDGARKFALQNLNKVCRTATHLFQFLAELKEMRGWGRSLRKAVASWYNAKDVDNLAYQIVKYRNRCGWTHKDVLRKASPKPKTNEHNALFRWTVGGNPGTRKVVRNNIETRYDAVSNKLPEIVSDFVKLNRTNSESEVIEIIRRNSSVTHEMVPQKFKTAKVWNELLPNLPLTALVRNLGSLTEKGVLRNLSDNTKMVCSKLRNKEHIKKSRLHPFSILNALTIYSSGRGAKGSLSWHPVRQIIDALNYAFYLSFENVETTGQNFYLGVDVSGSMGCACNGSSFTCRTGAAAMALMTAKTESNYVIKGFSHGLVDLNITPNDTLESSARKMSGIRFGATDCSKPIMDAIENKYDVDVFVIYTDNETWFGSIHPCRALDKYRKEMNKPNAKLVVVGMSASNFTIADPKDSGSMDVVGFDTATPKLISEFAKGF